MNRQELDARISEAVEKYGAFFAFSEAQFNRQKKDNAKYVSAGSGLICQENNVDDLLKEIEGLIDAFHESELRSKSRKDLIWEQLANHECQIRYDWTPAAEYLSGYGITPEEVKAEWPEYYRHCVEHNYF